MKKITVHAILVLITISPLFRGLFFNFETYAFMAVISLLSFIYYFCKIRNNETVHINKLYLIFSIILIISYILSFINAVNPRENLGSILLYTELAIIFHVLYDYFFGKKQQLIEKIMLTVVIAGFGCAIVGLEALSYSFDFLDITIFGKRLGSTFQYTNTASIYFVICILFSMTLINAIKNPIMKAVLSGGGNVFIFAFFMTGSRGGYLTGMVVILIFLLLQPAGYKLKGITNLIGMLIPLLVTFSKFSKSTSIHDYIASTEWLSISFILSAILYIFIYHIGNLIKKSIFKDKDISLPKGSVPIFFVVLTAMTVCIVLFWERFTSLLPAVLGSRLQNMSLNDPNILFRLECDKDALKLISDNLLLGLGGGSWLTVYQSIQDVHYTSNYIHNNYLQIFVETGILGFISYVALILISFIHAIISFFKAVDKELKIYISGILSGLIALAAHSAFDFDLSYISLTLLFWVMFVAASVSSETTENDTNKNTLKLSIIEKLNFVSRNNLYRIIPIMLCAILLSMYTLYFTGAYNANEAQKYMKLKSYKSAMSYYEEANRLDPMNSTYLFELSKLYYYFTENSKIEEERNIWLKRAITTGEKGISENRYYPPQLKTLIRIYQYADMSQKALDYSQKLVLFQRYKTTNYELLAKAYIEAAKHYEAENNIKKAKELLLECIALKENPYFIKSGLGIFDKVSENEDETNYIKNYSLDKYSNEAGDILKNLD